MENKIINDLSNTQIPEIARAMAEETATEEDIQYIISLILGILLEKIIDEYSQHEIADELSSDELTRLISAGLSSLTVNKEVIEKRIKRKRGEREDI